MSNFNALKNEIQSELRHIGDRLEYIRQKITENAKSADNPIGLLPRAEENYLKTIEFELEPLRDMVEEDVAHWDQNLEAAR